MEGELWASFFQESRVVTPPTLCLSLAKGALKATDPNQTHLSELSQRGQGPSNLYCGSCWFSRRNQGQGRPVCENSEGRTSPW